MAQVEEAVDPYLEILANKVTSFDFQRMPVEAVGEFYAEYCTAVIASLYTHGPQGRSQAIRCMKV